MSPRDNGQVLTSRVTPRRILALNTIAFTACFAVWMMYGALIKFLTSQGLYEFSPQQVGVLIAVPVLTGALLRLPVGILTDRLGGRPVFFGVLLLSALGAFSVTLADSFWGFLLSGLFFGLSGASFAVGIAYTSLWFEKDEQGTALGIFGAGNAGAAVTLMLGPGLLSFLTSRGSSPEGWRAFPVIYGLGLVAMAVAFWFLTENRRSEASTHKTLKERLAPLKNVQVWRFGYYYVLLFGCFVGLSGWLVKYYVDVYGVTLEMAGWLAAAFSLPSGVIRAIGGWLSDKSGARAVMYWVLGTCVVGSLTVCFPMSVVPFTVIVVVVGIAMGIGMAAVYKHIPVYFPQEVGVVGGMVGVLGGLGGFLCPVVFGILLGATTSSEYPTGLWTTSWMFISFIALTSLGWMHLAIRRMDATRARQDSAADLARTPIAAPAE